ncbi:MAG: nucleotidyl transferase AbiEii/AbiGii toxin family protein, partial [Candidatus Tectomicrobia bacterium]|nr:nucleotidyl transferase AbiEii/AbiGii toxin family protein [Candidatus Tectomicrobia bacterium]
DGSCLSWRHAVHFTRFLDLLHALQQHQVDYVLIGGVALNLHGIVRTTEDIDVFVRPEAENIARLQQALRSLWDDPDIDQITAAELAGEYPIIRYGPPGETFVIDVLSRLGTAFRFEDIAAETVQYAGIQVRVATPAMLYRMKRDTLRPINRADAAALRRRFLLGDEDDAHPEIP